MEMEFEKKSAGTHETDKTHSDLTNLGSLRVFFFALRALCTLLFSLNFAQFHFVRFLRLLYLLFSCSRNLLLNNLFARICPLNFLSSFLFSSLPSLSLACNRCLQLFIFCSAFLMNFSLFLRSCARAQPSQS